MRREIIMICVGLILGCACTQENDSVVNHPQQEAITPSSFVTEPQNLRIATWNVHNLFDTVCDSSNGCGGSNYEPNVSEQTYQNKISQVAKGIQKIDADILLLQEIEKESCLTDVQTYLGSGIYLGYAFGEIGTSASVDVAILTRGLLTNAFTYRDQYWIDIPDGTQKRMARELLGAEITLPNGLEVTVFTTHFISMYSDPEGVRRIGEANITQNVLNDYIAQHPGRLVVFGGDLNNTPDSDQIQLLINDKNLRSVTDGMQPEEYVTWGGKYTLDYLFYSSEFTDSLTKTEIFCDNANKNGFSGSDHCSVKATFSFSESVEPSR